jgi:translin
MKDISDIVNGVTERMDLLERLREKAIASSRAIIRMTKKAIHAIHVNERHEDLLNDAVKEFSSLYESIKDEPQVLFSGPVEDAMMELSEACILSSIVLGKNVPSYTTLNITPQSWAMGLADCLGELRRILLAHLMSDDIAKAKDIFDKMEEVCDAILSFDVPDAILPIRRKQDVARSVMERTRTDIMNAMMMSNAKLKY